MLFWVEVLCVCVCVFFDTFSASDWSRHWNTSCKWAGSRTTRTQKLLSSVFGIFWATCNFEVLEFELLLTTEKKIEDNMGRMCFLLLPGETIRPKMHQNHWVDWTPVSSSQIHPLKAYWIHDQPLTTDLVSWTEKKLNIWNTWHGRGWG